MNKTEMIREVAGLASGTLARLFHTASYLDLDRALTAWVEWVQAQPDDARWATWQDCYNAYADVVVEGILAKLPAWKPHLKSS